MNNPDKILVDANIFIALANENDAHHKRVLAIQEELKARKTIFITNNHIVDEALTVIATRTKTMIYATTLGDSIYGEETPWFRVFRVSHIWEQEAYILFRTQKKYQKDKFLSFTDCILLVQAQQQAIPILFTFDIWLKDYKQEGLTVIS